MNLVFLVIIGIILGCFLLTTLWIFFNFLKNSKRDYNLYKSVYKSVFSRKLSLSIIVIFYLISFGLVGGLTSALGRLNSEVTSYIQENHLHQGLVKQTQYNKNSPEKDTLGQKSFYLGTQGVIDFVEWTIINNDETLTNDESIKDSTFIDMIGGQKIIFKKAPKEKFYPNNPTTKEILNGSTSPLSIRANQYNKETYQTYQTYSMMDISAFWNAWYEDADPSLKLKKDWTTYYYNTNERHYEIKPGHKNEKKGAINWTETKLNKFIFNPTKTEISSSDDEYWTFDDAILDENNGYDSFSSVAYNIFDRDLNKYYSMLGTYVVKTYLQEFDVLDNQFASTRVFEYQKHAYNTDFLLQSYNKNQVLNEDTFLNNSATDKNGNYSIDTMKFFDNKGKEIAGPKASDDFFKAHQGTKDDPYLVYLSAEYYEAHNWDSKDNGAFSPLPKSPAYFQVEGSYRSPTYSFPIQTFSSTLQDPADNAAILINTQSLLRLTRSPSLVTTDYEFFGFSNVYNKTNRAVEWYYSEDSNKAYVPSTDYPFLVTKYVRTINNFFGDTGWDNDELVAEYWGENKPQDFSLYGETLYDQDSLISYRSFTIIQEIYGDQIFFSVIMAIFLLITIIVLILLIRKRIQDSNKQLGTIKALGFDPSRIASAYTIFPIIIIILGSISAIVVALPLSLLFTSIYGGFYSLNLSGVYVGLMLWLKVLILPLIISMFIGYWMAYHTIKKPTLDLLNNVNNDKPNVLVRGTSYLIPTFTSFEFTYKTKGIGRAFFKSLLLFFAIVGSMSITSFAFAASTMTSTMTKQVFDIVNYDSKTLEFGAPFIEDFNINENDYANEDNKENCFDLFDGINLVSYLKEVLSNPELAYDEFENLLPEEENINFKFAITYDENGNPEVISDYYIDWKTAVALLVTNIALHVPIENSEQDTRKDEDGDKINDDLDKPIYEEGEVTFKILDPLLQKYAINLVTNIVTRYETESAFTFLHFFNKFIGDYKNGDRIELGKDFKIIKQWFNDHNIENIYTFILGSLENKDIFNDIVFNKNYYDGPNNEGEINQTICTSFYSYFLKTDLNGNLILNSKETKFKNSNTYMEGYPSIDELIAANDVGFVAENHLRESNANQGHTDELYNNVVNVAMTEAEFETFSSYKKATPMINSGLSSPNQALVLANTKVWSSENNMYETAYVPVVLDVVVYDSIFPLGTFFLQEDMDNAIDNSLAWTKSDVGEEKIIEKTKDLNKEFLQDWSYYNDFTNEQLALSGVASYENNYSITYNIDTIGNENFKTAPFSISLGQKEISTLIENDNIKNKEEIPFIYLVENAYTPYSIPLSIDTIISQGSRIYALFQGILNIIAFFSLFIGVTIVMIAMKDIMDSNKREVSMFKAFGYSNGRATSLVITPYLFVIGLAFIVAIPLSLVFLSLVGTILTAVTGTTYIFVLAIWQWIIVIGFILGLISFLGFLGYKSYQHTNALEAISETNE